MSLKPTSAAAARADTLQLQKEIKRLRSVLYQIAESRPDAHMDLERETVLVEWICKTCFKARVGAYPT